MDNNHFETGLQRPKATLGADRIDKVLEGADATASTASDRGRCRTSRDPLRRCGNRLVPAEMGQEP